MKLVFFDVVIWTFTDKVLLPSGLRCNLSGVNYEHGDVTYSFFFHIRNILYDYYATNIIYWARRYCKVIFISRVALKTVLHSSEILVLVALNRLIIYSDNMLSLTIVLNLSCLASLVPPRQFDWPN